MKKILSMSMVAVIIVYTLCIHAFALTTDDVIVSGTKITATPGEIVKVPIALEKNNGFCGLNLYFTFPSELSLVSLSNSVDSLVCTHSITTVWDSADNYTGTGQLAILEFKIPNEATPGVKYTIDINFIEAYDANLNDVSCSTLGAEIIIVDDSIDDDSEYTLGDINADGAINGKDSNQLKQFISGSSMPTAAELLAADVNGDGAINGVDANIFAQFLSGAIGGF